MANEAESSLGPAPVAVVTGANSGLGLETVRGLADRGFHVLMAARRLERTQEVAEQIRSEGEGRQLTAMRLDLADLEQVRRFADRVLEAHPSIDLLFNNAGVMGVPRAATVQGFETHMGVNHLGHFALTSHLFGALERSGRARVIVVSSHSHRWARLDTERMGGPLEETHPPTKSFDWMAAYAASKFANLSFAFEFDRRLRASGRTLRCVAAHPGYTESGIGTHGARQSGSRLKERFFQLGNRVLAQSTVAGARVSLYAALEAHLSGGEYIGPGGLLEMRGAPKEVGSTRKVRDEATARALWQRSVQATGADFGGL